MNEVKIQYKALIFKSCILLLLFVFIVFPALKAQSLADTNHARNLYDSAKVHYTIGDFNNAIQILNKILKIKSKESHDTNPKYFRVYNRLGYVYKIQGSFLKAINLYEKAIDHTIDKYSIARINGNIANIYSETGDYAKAISYLEESLLILQNSGHKDKYLRIINTYHNQGHAFYKSGQMNLALEKDLESIRLAKENNLNIEGSVFYNTGLAYQALDSLSKADFYFKEAINTYIRNFGENYYMTAMAYMNYAIFCAEIGKYNLSEQFYLKAYKIFINSLGSSHMYTAYCLKNIGNLYTKKGNYKEALIYYQKSLASKINNFNDSSIYANPSPDVFPDLDLLNVLKGKAHTLEMLATQENKEANLKAALSTLELTVGFIEQLRMGYLYENSKLVLAEKEYETYMSIIKIAYELLSITGNTDYINVAFKYSERSKYAILRESMDEEYARNTSIPDSVQKLMQGIKEQIGIIRLQIENENKLASPDGLKQNELKEKLFRFTQSQEETIKELEQNYPEYYKRKHENSVVSITGLQSILVQKEAVISYELTDNTLYTFVITKDKYNLLCNPVDSTFYNNLKSYSDFLHTEHLMPYESFRVPSYELFQKLIEPTLKYTEGKNLLIIPNSELSLISFDALTTEPYVEQEFADYRTEPYLILQYPIGYSYSATLYANSKHRKKKWNPRLLSFTPDYKKSRDTLTYLPPISRGINRISVLTRGKIFTQERATEYNLKKQLSSYGILYLNAHGYEDLNNPHFSKIYLSYKNDSIEDGYLYAYEVNELELNSELVVLASCFSGSGAINKGEGVLSIGRSFMNSGTPSIITSLWLAYYEPAVFELEAFFWHLISGKRKDEALRLAKLKYFDSAIELEAHPKYWTSLVVIGNQDPVFKGYLLKLLLLPVILLFILMPVFLKISRKRHKKAVKMHK